MKRWVASPPPFTRISRIPGAGHTPKIGLSGSGGRGGRSGEPRPQGRWAGFGSNPSRTLLFGFGVAGMSSAMPSRKLTAEDRRTPISQPFLFRAVVSVDVDSMVVLFMVCLRPFFCRRRFGRFCLLPVGVVSDVTGDSCRDRGGSRGGRLGTTAQAPVNLYDGFGVCL